MGSEKPWVGCKQRRWGVWNEVSCGKRATRDGYCGTHHPDAKARRDAKRAERWQAENALLAKQRERERHERACVNALTGIPDPIAWVEAVERLVEAAQAVVRIGDRYSAVLLLSDAVRALLALQSPAEEKSDG